MAVIGTCDVTLVGFVDDNAVQRQVAVLGVGVITLDVLVHVDTYNCGQSLSWGEPVREAAQG